MGISEVSSWRVLVVDDEQDSIDAVRLVLVASGATVFEAHDGAEGLEVFERERPNIVLSDLSMPGMDGWEMLKKIRASEGGAGSVVVIALTAHAMISDRERVLEAGFDGYMSKPITMFTLVENLAQFVNG